MKAKKHLGQNFLLDKIAIQKIVNDVDATQSDLIIEIGPGRGALTKLLKEKGAYLIAYEADRDLSMYLNGLENEKTKIIYGDFLESNILNDIKDIKYNNIYFVGNLPYYITTPIIEHIIKQNIIFKKFTLMVQKEVALRFMAKPRSKEYGYFTVLLNHYFDINKVVNVSKNAFRPVPKVDSTVINFIPKTIDFEIDEDYVNFLKMIFSQKRKTLKNNLKDYDWSKIKTILDRYQLNEFVRSEELDIPIIRDIYMAISK